jgi:hypothetical protein
MSACGASDLSLAYAIAFTQRCRPLAYSSNETTLLGKGRSTSVADGDKPKVGKNLVIKSADSVTMETGDAGITMRKDGTVMIKSNRLAIDGLGKVYVMTARSRPQVPRQRRGRCGRPAHAGEFAGNSSSHSAVSPAFLIDVDGTVAHPCS